MFLLQGANASALEKEIGSEQFPVNEHYFGLVNVSSLTFRLALRSLVCSRLTRVPFSPHSSGTPATATRCSRLCTSAGRFGRRSWPTGVSLGARRTCSPAWPTCSTASPTRRGRWASSLRRNSSHGCAKRTVRETSRLASERKIQNQSTIRSSL